MKGHESESYETVRMVAGLLFAFTTVTRQVYDLFQEPVEQPPLGFSIADEKKSYSFKAQTG